MPGTFSINPPPMSLARPAAFLTIYRYNQGASLAYELMPNLRCLSIHEVDGAEPGSARFRYAFGDPLGNPLDPQRIEQVFPIDASYWRVVKTDDRLCVFRLNSDGSETIMFDGFCQLPQGDLGEQTESVTFECMATPIREFDTPLPGALYRNATATITANKDIQTDLPARFNPDGQPNSVLDSVRSGFGVDLYPVFIDTNIVRVPEVRKLWYLPEAAAYIQIAGNISQTWTNRCPVKLLANLVSIEPVQEDQPIDLNDISTYTLKEIVVPDVDVTGDAWPLALEKLIKPHGFGVRWHLDTDGNKHPRWSLQVFDAA